MRCYGSGYIWEPDTYKPASSEKSTKSAAPSKPWTVVNSIVTVIAFFALMSNVPDRSELDTVHYVFMAVIAGLVGRFWKLAVFLGIVIAVIGETSR